MHKLNIKLKRNEIKIKMIILNIHNDFEIFLLLINVLKTYIYVLITTFFFLSF